MCLIAHAPEGTTFPERLRSSVFTRNKDGFGVMYSNRDDTVTVEKILPKSPDEIEPFLEKTKDQNVAFHWRMRTHGSIDLSQVHPYRVTSKSEGDDLDIYMMHNGVLRCVNEVFPTKSDTWHFIEGFLRPVLLKDPDILYDSDFIKTLGAMIGTNNKFLIYRGDDAEPFIINEKSGVDDEKKYEGCWLSNTYAYTDPSVKSAPYIYNSHGYGPRSSPATKSSRYITGYGWATDEEWGMMEGMYPGIYRDTSPATNLRAQKSSLEFEGNEEEEEQDFKSCLFPAGSDADISDPYYALTLAYDELELAVLQDPDSAADLIWTLLHETPGTY